MDQGSLLPQPPGEPERATLEGTLERFVFASPDSAWCVARLRVPRRRELVTAVGPLWGSQPGEVLRLTGHWVVDRKYGEQFRAEQWLSVKPATLGGIEKYLGSGLVRGIGPVMAQRLVGRFGLETLEVIERQPERLAEVEGIGPVRSRRIHAAWREQQQIQQVMVFLQSHEVAAQLAVKVWRHYGDDALRVVSQEPYRLATEVFGIGFATADRIARRLGVAEDSPQRVAAGTLHALGEASSQGHLFLPLPELARRASELLAVGGEEVAAAVASLASEERVVVEPLPGEEGPAVWLRALFLAERSLAIRLARLLAAPARPLAVDAAAACQRFEERHGIELAPAQREAVRQVLAHQVVVVTGGPGTGKTTLVRALVEVFAAAGQRIELAAPTGRAAKRLAESTGREARTVHRLLEFAPQSARFERDEERPLAADLLVVDEVSMVDTVLAHHLLKAVPTTSRVVLVGDADQLPSVGPGAVLADLIASGRTPVVSLSHVFRQAQRSLIVTNAHRVRRGELPRLPEGDAPSDFFFIERASPDELLATLDELVSRRIPRRFGLDPLRDVQVLSPMRRGTLGTRQLNLRLQDLLNPGGRPVGQGGQRLRIGDRVMQVRNDYDRDVFNGDLGVVSGWDEEEGEVLVAVEERTVRYDARDLDELDLAYACSIHKSQGSEYPCVVLVLHGQHHVMLQRNLLYTGLTRARRLAVLLGSRAAVARAVRNDEQQRRATRLAARLRESG